MANERTKKDGRGAHGGRAAATIIETKCLYSPRRLNGRTRTATLILSVAMLPVLLRVIYSRLNSAAANKKICENRQICCIRFIWRSRPWFWFESLFWVCVVVICGDGWFVCGVDSLNGILLCTRIVVGVAMVVRMAVVSILLFFGLFCTSFAHKGICMCLHHFTTFLNTSEQQHLVPPLVHTRTQTHSRTVHCTHWHITECRRSGARKELDVRSNLENRMKKKNARSK